MRWQMIVVMAMMIALAGCGDSSDTASRPGNDNRGERRGAGQGQGQGGHGGSSRAVDRLAAKWRGPRGWVRLDPEVEPAHVFLLER